MHPLRPEINYSIAADLAKKLRTLEKKTVHSHGHILARHRALKITIVFFWALCTYGLLYFVEAPIFLLILCLLSALGHTAMGFNVFHDAIHGSLWKKKSTNKIFELITCSLLGVSGYLWRFKHNYLHHQFTNIQNIDDDLETRNSLRLSPYQETRWIYPFQHLYAPFVYAMTTLEWIFIKDFKQYFTRKMSPYQTIPKFKLKDHFEFWFCKIIYFSLYLVLPFLFFNTITFFIGFFFFHFTKSLFLASIFQLAHVMPGSQYYTSNEVNHSHLANQVLTTVNFANDSSFLTWISGGLNFQIEHHLFPRLSHHYYPYLKEELQKILREEDLPYHEIKNYKEALLEHFRELKRLGIEKKYERTHQAIHS